MAWLGRTVNEALDRWVEKGLLPDGKAEELRAEAREARTAFTRRLGQLVLAALGAFALVAAAVLFAEKSWTSLSWAARTGIIVVAGGAVYGVGLGLARRTALRNTSVLLQAGGLSVILAGTVYSANAWPQGTAGAVLVGLFTLAVPLALLTPSLHQGVVMTGVHTALSFVYLAVGLDRSLGLEMETIVWILDGVLLLLLAGLWLTARSWSPEHRSRGLVALGVSFWAGLLLAFFTGVGPLDMSEEAVYPMDLWALIMTAVTLWGLHGAPAHFRRDVYEANLAGMVAVLGLLAMFTAGEVWNLDAEGAAAAAVTVGLMALGYGLRQDTPAVLVVGGLVALFGTWVFAVESAGALGGAGALLVSAAVLFWISSRVREERGGPGAEAGVGGGTGDTRPLSG